MNYNKGMAGKNTNHSYYVCNTDESYADKVLQIILKGEDVKHNKENAMYQSPYYQKRETARKIICDKYGLEGDSSLDSMIDDIIVALDNLKLF